MAHDGFDFPLWMETLDKESRARLDRFLEMTAEAVPERKAPGPENRIRRTQAVTNTLRNCNSAHVWQPPTGQVSNSNSLRRWPRGCLVQGERR
jgi:hypothetical protein